MASVSLRRLAKRYGPEGRPALEDLSLDVGDGELFVLLGPSGCGKTTTLRCIAGLEEPSAGEILIGERDCWGHGYGTEATQLVLDYGFTVLGLHNIMLSVRDWNTRGIRAYERAGFKRIGSRRASVRFGGRAYDEVLMDCVASEFKSPHLARLLAPETDSRHSRRR